MVPAHARRRLVCLFAVVTGLLTGAGLSRGEDASLFGRVADAGGKPLAGVNVSLYLDDTDAEQRYYRKLRDVTTAADGAYEFADLPAGWYLVVAEREGLARSFWYSVLEEGAQLSQTFTMRRPVTSVVTVGDADGHPVSGARLRTLSFRDDTGEFFVRRRDEWELFEMVVPPSDEDGRLRLPELPEGSVFTVTIDHDDLAPAEVKDVKAGSETMTEVVMKPGTTVALKIAGDEDGGTISEAEIDCRHDPFSHPSSIFWRHVPVDDEGTARVTVEAGRYRLLRLTHHDYYILPEYSPNISDGEFLRIGDSAHEEFYFQMFPKVKVRGRVVDPTGKPLAKLRVLGELPNGDFDQLPSTISAEAMPDEWAYVDFVETNEQGEYTLELAAGPARVHAEGQGYLTDQEHIDVHVAADGSTVVPDIVVRPMPDITGTVVDQSGQPVEGAIVRLRGELRFMQPTKTDEHGKFQLSPWWIPVDFNTKESKPEQPLYAYHPYERLGVHTTIRLNKPDSLKDLTLTLSPQEPQAFLDGYREESTPAERGEVNQERLAEHGAGSLIGQPAPPLDGTWLNTDEPAEGLAAFRGKYVLLDFWFIGCGPCHADYPSVQLLHDLYKDQGVVVIAVHNNSATADAVRQFAEKEGMHVPIIVDEPDGTTIARYEGRGLRGYPSHILIGPDGTVVDDDETTPGPSLRTYKIELIRELLLKPSTE